MRPFISLLTDFGVRSEDVGLMKGAILKICPDANIIDLTHEVRSFDVKQGSILLETVRYLPVGFHVAVVDYGVGTNRKALIIKTKRGDYLIGPDNGLLIPAANLLGVEKIVSITNEKYMQKPVSPVFHGRDIFAPAAAWLANGVNMEEFGPELKSEGLVPPAYQRPKIKNGAIESEVININKFLNIVTTIPSEFLKNINVKLKDDIIVKIKEKEFKMKFLKTFGETGKGKPLLFENEFGKLEIALNQDGFAKKYNINIGDKMMLRKG